MSGSDSLGWWLSGSELEQSKWMSLLDREAGEVLLNQTLPWCPRDWDGDTDRVVLSPFQQLALTALQREL